MVRDYSYAVFQFYQRHKQILIADHIPTIDDAERIASQRARFTRKVHIVVNTVTQAIIARFEGTEHRPRSRDAHQDGPMALGDALDVRRKAEKEETELERNEEYERKNRARRVRKLCPAHWRDLDAAECEPGFKYCSFRHARKSGIPNSYFVDKPLAQCDDSALNQSNNLGVQGKNEARNEQSHGSGSGSGAAGSPQEGLPDSDTSPVLNGGKHPSD